MENEALRIVQENQWRRNKISRIGSWGALSEGPREVGTTQLPSEHVQTKINQYNVGNK